MKKLSIYFLIFRRCHENFYKSLGVLSNLPLDIKGRLEVNVVDDASNSSELGSKLEKIVADFAFIKLTTNNENLGIINNPLEIIKRDKNEWIQFISDDDLLDENYVLFLREFFRQVEIEEFGSFFGSYRELNNQYRKERYLPTSFEQKYWFLRMLSFMFNQTDMYMHGIHNVKSFETMNFSRFTFGKSPQSWGYLFVMFGLSRARLRVVDIPFWNYNSSSPKAYDKMKHSVTTLFAYFIREIELHIRYFGMSKYPIIGAVFIPLIPVIILHKLIKRHLLKTALS